MKCENISSKMIDYLDGKLNKPEKAIIVDHISNCMDCSKLHDELSVVLGLMSDVNVEEPSNQLRSSFNEMLAKEKERKSIGIDINQTKQFPWKMAFQIAASVLLVCIGFMLGGNNEDLNNKKEITELQYKTEQLKQGMMMALIDNRSPSKRIKAVSYTEEIIEPNNEILEAVIDRLQFDENSNVRLAAAEALANYSNIELVKKVFIERLNEEENSGVQIEIIRILVGINDNRAVKPMKKLLEQSNTAPFVKSHVNQGLIQLSKSI